ncbi:MAG: cofactor-independent phosphoglycerate mutase [Chloroflexi bacterium]|nr:cofactor-independent phosphoglycerate mutase [Chloroflexota bacterium]
MKYCVLIMDGAAGWPLVGRGQQTCLELARTPNLNSMTREGILGLARTVPEGMEPSSACACMSVLGYDPVVYYKGRAAIEARSMGIPVGQDEVVFRCNLVAVKDGRMADYSAGHISTEEARELIAALNDSLGNENIHFYPGVSFRHILKVKGRLDVLDAACTPPHDIHGKPVAGFLPRGAGSDFVRDLMVRSEAVLEKHPVNLTRQARDQTPATTIWLFWGTGQIPEMPPFRQVYGLNGAMTSGVDLLRGLADMASMDMLKIPGVTDALDNDFAAQAEGALEALQRYDMAVIHIEAPDEAGHSGSIEDKVKAIELIDGEVLSRVRSQKGDGLRVLVMPDHPTPIEIRTHCPEPVPFLLWGQGFAPNGAKRFTETEAKQTGLCVDPGYSIMTRLIGRGQD